MKKMITVFILLAVASLCTMACAAEPELTIENERFENGGIVYEVSANEPLAGTLICAVYDADGVLSGVAIEESPSPQTAWTIHVNTTLNKGKSKMFFWNSIESMQPWVKSVSSNWDRISRQSVHRGYPHFRRDKRSLLRGLRAANLPCQQRILQRRQAQRPSADLV